jgi:general secretion pathway protein J
MSQGGHAHRLHRPAMCRADRARAGYTLIEFVIALTLVGLIMVLITGGIFLGARTWDAVDAKAESVSETRQALEFLRRQLTAARGLRHQLPEEDALLFWGNRQMLEWVAPLPPYVGNGGLSVMRLSVVGEAPRRQLLFEHWFFHPKTLTGEAGAAPIWTPLVATRVTDGEVDAGIYGRHVLIAQLQDFELAYFGAAERGGALRWFSQWEGIDALPRLVKIRLRQADEDWPDMVVALPDPTVRRRGG